VVQGSKI